MTTEFVTVSISISAIANLSNYGLVGAHVTDLLGIRAFDVGQGDCIGLLDQHGAVFCYVDYGGLVDHPDKSNPSYTIQRMPTKIGNAHVSIVLTHWDKDHYWSAKHKNPDAQRCRWLVPRQLVSPQALLFARGLANGECWPESVGNTSHSWAAGSTVSIQIRKVAPFDPLAVSEDRNLSGLALSLVKAYDSDRTEMILLPGDCPFDRIPNLPAIPAHGLVAYHHGSRAHWSPRTRRAISNFCESATMIYSFGSNSYGHPRRGNYRPHWDSRSTTTASLRRSQRESVDLRW